MTISFSLPISKMDKIWPRSDDNNLCVVNHRLKLRLRKDTDINVSYFDHTVLISDRGPTVTNSVVAVAQGDHQLTKRTPLYLANFKNPCWWKSNKNSTLLCLPYFFLAGFPKSGTTDLYRRLVFHPLILNGTFKESQYFTRDIFSPDNLCLANSDSPHTCSIERFAQNFFGKASTQILRNRKAKDELTGFDCEKEVKNIKKEAEITFTHPMIAIDGSASTAWDSNNWQKIEENQNCSLPVYLIADMIVKVIPNTRLIMLLREPVDRAHSDYVYFNSNASASDFHHKILQFLQHFQNCIKSHSSKECVHSVQTSCFESRARLDIGLYYVFVSEWLQRVPRDRLLILRTEDYGKNVTTTVQQAFRFLQLPQVSPKALNKIEALLRSNENKARREKVPMLPDSRRLLSEFYEPYNRKLAQLLGDDRFTWRDVKP
ncbi:Carbohydrate sulfotransferase 15 [Bulinus truncatus]|nr:Carbohydrate sulfotransferase 15 [Bulinus truncatus]